MKNETSVQYFYILPFSGETRNKPLITTFFFLIYLVGVLLNSSIITVICREVQLHEPMYLFICNLSIVDIVYTSVTVPKLLYISFLSGNHFVSFSQCYTQFYFFVTLINADDIFLFLMAYDRYVAICLPLHYHRILSRRNCILITIGIWTASFLTSLMYVNSILYMSSCHSNLIHQFFCDIKSVTRTTCIGTELLLIITAMEFLLFVFLPLMYTFISYVNIFFTIFKMKSRESRRKAFYTCSSHITVISIFYGASLIDYLIPTYSYVLDLSFAVVYTTITPMINPIIYSLQNSKIKIAFQGIVKEMHYL